MRQEIMKRCRRCGFFSLGSLISFAAISSIWIPVIHGGPLTRHLSEDVPNEVTNNSLTAAPPTIQHSCRYQGSVYSYDEVIPTDEPCLVCQCKSAVVCKLRICEELPAPPPPGCIVVHKAKQCCAQLICDNHGPETHRKLSRENRLSTTNTSLPATVTTDKAYCVLDGTVYAEGSAMRSSSLCEYCFCIRGEMKCSRPQCIIPMNGCKPRFRSYACCPTNYDCHSSNATAVLKTTPSVTPVPQFLKGCTVQGKRIREGEPVLALEIGNHTDPCQTCFCMGGTVRCRPLECDRAIEGCTPIKEDGHCCPDRYKCDNGSVEDGHVTEHGLVPATVSVLNGNTPFSSLHDTNLLSRQIKPVDGVQPKINSQEVKTDIVTEIYAQDGTTIAAETVTTLLPLGLQDTEIEESFTEKQEAGTTLGPEMALENSDKKINHLKLAESVPTRAERRNKDRTSTVELNMMNSDPDGTTQSPEVSESFVTGETNAYDPEARQTTTNPETTQGGAQADADETTTVAIPTDSASVSQITIESQESSTENTDTGRTEASSTPRMSATTHQLQGEITTSVEMEDLSYGVRRQPLEPSLPQALIDYRGEHQQIESLTTKIIADVTENTHAATEPATPVTKETVSDHHRKTLVAPESIVKNVHFISFGPEDAVPMPSDENRKTPWVRPPEPTYDHHALRLSLIPPSMPNPDNLPLRSTGRLSGGHNLDAGGRESKVAVLTSDDFRNAIMDVPVSTSLYSNGYYRNGYIVQDSYDPSELEIRTSLAFPGEVFDDKETDLEEQSPPYSDKMPQATSSPSTHTTPPPVTLDENPSRTHSKFGIEDSPLHRGHQKNGRNPEEAPQKESEPAPFLSFLELADQRNPNILKHNSEMISHETDGSEQVLETEDGSDDDHYEKEGEEEEDEEEEETEEAASPEVDQYKDQYFYQTEYTTQGKTTQSPPTTTPMTKYVFPQRRPPKKNSSTLIPPDTHQISRVGAFGGFKESPGKDPAFRPALAIPFTFPKASSPFNLGLKLSGCNIYGKMYNVGSLIPELSSSCGKCLCTEVGVHCSQVQC